MPLGDKTLSLQKNRQLGDDEDIGMMVGWNSWGTIGESRNVDVVDDVYNRVSL